MVGMLRNIERRRSEKELHASNGMRGVLCLTSLTTEYMVRTMIIDAMIATCGVRHISACEVNTQAKRSRPRVSVSSQVRLRT